MPVLGFDVSPQGMCRVERCTLANCELAHHGVHEPQSLCESVSGVR